MKLSAGAAGTLVAMISAAVLATSLSLGSHLASGSDSYGYVSQAQLFSQGRLIQPEPLVRLAAWPNAAATLAPLGYRPAQRQFGNVPTYAPGLPLLMAVARVVFGPCAVFVIVPLAAGLLVWLTYVTALQVSDPLVAAGAAIWLAASPTFGFMTMWPMSDVPVTACWLLALYLAATGSTWRRALLTGFVTGLAILIRPNLVPLAVVPAGLTLIRLATFAPFATSALMNRSALLRAAAAVIAGMIPFIAAIAILNAQLYGSPLESGYGSLRGLYSSGNIATNFTRQIGWLIESQGVFAVAMVLGAVLQLRRGFSNVLTWGLLLAVLVWCSYLPYHTFDAWWYLRFLLPAFPILFIVAVDGVAFVSGWLGPSARAAVTILFVAAATFHGLRFGYEKRITAIGEGEQRALEVATYVAETMPEKVVLISGQQSGSLRYYAGRTTLRFDQLDGNWLDRTVEMLSGLGYHPYAVLEGWEEQPFRVRFHGQETVRRLGEDPVAVLDSPLGVKVYDLHPATAEKPPAVVQIRHVPSGACPEPR